MDLTELVIEVQELLPGTREQVFALLVDVERMGGLGPENVRSAWQDDQRGVGAVFRGWNARGDLRWDVPNLVVEHDPPTRFAFVTGNPDLPSAVWTYDLADHEGGTLVTQVFRHGPGVTFLRRSIADQPEREAELIAGRCADLETGMRTTLRAAAELL